MAGKKADKFIKFGDEEIKLLTEVIRSGNLFYWNGEKTKLLCERIKNYFNVSHVATASSGTAAIHGAVGALEIEPGYEVITSPITDMGTLIGLLYQNLIPVFADVDPGTYNITADSIEKVISDRTKAIIVVHLAGNPAEMDPILKIASDNNIAVIEDCAQSYGARYRGQKIGTFGDFGCYSLNAFKHISCGDGGFVMTSDESLYKRVVNFLDKSYDRLNTGLKLTTLAPCYRITELQSAVAAAQFAKLDHIVKNCHELGTIFNDGIKGLEGIHAHEVKEGNYCSYWFTMFTVDPEIVCSATEFSMALLSEGISASPGYIPRPIYLEPVFQNKSFFPGNIWPAEMIAGKKVEYKPGLCPNAEQVLKNAVRVSIEETQTEDEVKQWVERFKHVHEFYLEDNL
ncbi:MAG: DegT/DnrJ/EryC1/StrS family aminotransferase [Promethearchaeota archaeon]